MKAHSDLTSEEMQEASRAAMRGGFMGAAKYGIPAAIFGALANSYSPLYRGLTIQFKIFLQLSAMTLGGWISADRGLRHYELMRRRIRRAAMLQQPRG